MRVHFSVVFALFSSPPVIASNKPLAVSGVSEALVDLSRSLLSTGLTHFAPIETDDPDTFGQTWLYHRELQEFTEACNATYMELWQDQALNDAYAVYSAGIDDALASLSTASDTCVAGSSAADITCDFDQPINGETEFTSACTTAGGELFSYTLDSSCTGMLDGQSGSLVLDLPTMNDCIPTSADFDSCTDAIRALIKNATDIYSAIAEGIFTAEGFTDVSCVVADVVAPGEDGGSDVGATPETDGGSEEGGESATGGGDSGATSDNGGSSKASSLGGLLLAFGMTTIIVSLTTFG